MNAQLRIARQATRRYATGPSVPPRAPAPPPLAPGSAPRPVVIVPPTTTPNALPPPPGVGLPPPSGPRRRPVRRFLLYSTLLTLGFYGASGLAAQHSEAYREFFTSNVPGGDVVVNYADENDWDRVGWGSVSKKGLQTVDYVKGRFGEGNVPHSTDEAKGVVDSWKAKAGQAVNDAKASVKQAGAKVEDAAKGAANDASVKANEASKKGNAAANQAERTVDSAFNDAKATASSLASRAEATLRDASTSAQETAAELKAKAERAAHDFRSLAGDVADDVKARASAAMSEAEKAAHAAEDKAVALGQDVKARARSAMSSAERAAHEAQDKAVAAGQQVRAKAGEAMTEAERAARAAEQKTLEAGSQVRQKAGELMSDAERAAYAAKDKTVEAGRQVQDKAGAAMSSAERAAHEAERAALAKARDVKARAEAAAHDARVATANAAHDAKVQAEKAYNDAKAAAANTADKLSAEATRAREAAVSKAERALREAEAKAERAAHDVKNVVSPPEASRDVLADTARPRELRPETVKPKGPSYEGLQVYSGPPLPLGHEPPPGYYIPRPKAPSGAKVSGTDKSDGVAPTLPLLAPQVKDFASVADEPIIAQLAGTIDSLAASLHNAEGPNAASPSTILTKAQTDLTALSTRLQNLKDEEKRKMEKTVEEKKHEFERVLETKQQEWHGKESHLKESWDNERDKLVAGWRKVLDGELESQRQGIEKRLREEVVSQGIELQRRWLRSIKTQVEQERGGRLSKLDTLSTNLKQLERITLDNSTQLDDNVRLHKLWSALRAVQAKADRGNQRFDDELRVLQTVISSQDADADKVIQAAVANVERSGAAQTGVKSMPSLSSWFTQTVSPRIHSVSLVPTEEGQAGVLSHVSSIVLSKILFRPPPSLVKGDDVNAVLSRAEFYLAEKDLDAAAREVNQLKGWPAKLAADWLREARRRLEVQQALDIVATEATLSSLLLV